MSFKIARAAYSADALIDGFRRDHPGTPILAAGPTKTIVLAPDHDEAAMVLGKQWQRALRGVLIVTADSLICWAAPGLTALHGKASGIDQPVDLTIPVTDILKATVFDTRYAGIQGQVLSLRLADSTVRQFGLAADQPWTAALPFAFEQREAKASYSVYSIALRVALLVAFFAAIWLLARAF
jgi:hypothetical protein